MKYRMLLPVMLIAGLRLAAQQTEFSNYDWPASPARISADTIKPVDGSLITMERRITEVYANAGGDFEEINVFHRKIRVTTHDALNANNKIYIPVDNVIEILRIKARFISPDGSITELPEKSIRQIDNLDNKGNYKTFAIEGAVTGGEIEFFYTLRKKYNAYGSVVMQGDQPRTGVEVIFAFPSKLDYFVKGYNGFPNFETRKDSLREVTYLEARVPVIPSLKEERYASYKASLMRYEFTLAHNYYHGNLRVYSYATVCRNIYSNLYDLTKAENKALKSYLKKLNLTASDAVLNIREIENRVKAEIVISEELKATAPLDEILRLKQTNKYGATRLLVNLLNLAGIDFRIVATCDKDERAFDPDFNGWNFLDDYVIYFPGLHQYILPDNPFYRLGVNASQYQGVYGLFLRPLHYGESFHTFAWEVDRLPVDSYEQNTDSLFINLKAELEAGNLKADIHRVFTGELAASYQSFWQLLPEERRKEAMEPIFSMANQQTDITAYTLTHAAPADMGIHPLVWEVSLTARSLIEQAGNDLIVRIGETIGEQSEMYQQEARRLPVVVSEVHNYYRRIVFEIPEGYEASGLDGLNMKVEMLNEGRVSCCFSSWFELQGSRLVIYSKEYYSESGYPASRFEEFRKVINAAADFNKKTIILSKSST